MMELKQQTRVNMRFKPAVSAAGVNTLPMKCWVRKTLTTYKILIDNWGKSMGSGRECAPDKEGEEAGKWTKWNYRSNPVQSQKILVIERKRGRWWRTGCNYRQEGRTSERIFYLMLTAHIQLFYVTSGIFYLIILLASFSRVDQEKSPPHNLLIAAI